MPVQQTSERRAAQAPHEPPRPLLLIEVLVAEYEHQRLSSGAKFQQLHFDNISPPGTDGAALHPLDEGRAAGGDQPPPALKQVCDEIWTASLQSADLDEQEKSIAQAQNPLLEQFYRQLHTQPNKRAALCFSGGGIRSATFVLGLLQGLSRKGVRLDQFQYISTVSGGGYIGSWLSAWMHRRGLARVQRELGEAVACPPPSADAPLSSTMTEGAIAGLTDVMQSPRRARTAARASSSQPLPPLNPEPAPLQHLRRYSNFMSPKLGLLSADTWTLVGIFLRNLFLNWLVLLPLLMVVLGIPRVAMSIASWNYAGDWRWVEQAAILIGFLTGVIAVAYTVASLPSWRRQSALPESYKTEKSFLRLCLVTLLAAAFLCAAYWSWSHIPLDAQRRPTLYWLEHKELLPFLLMGVFLMAGGYLIARFLFRSQPTVADGAKDRGAVRLVLSAVAGLLIGAGLWAAVQLPSSPRLLRFVLFGTAFHVVGYLIARLAFIKRQPARWVDDLIDFSTRALAGALGGLCLWAVALAFTPPVEIAALPKKGPVVTASPSPTPLGGQAVATSTPSLASTPASSPTPAPASSPASVATLTVPLPATKIEVTVSPQAAAPVEPETQRKAREVNLRAGIYTCLAPPLFVLMFLIASTIFIGLASGYTNDADREWLARSGGWMLLAISGWVVFSGLAIFGPVALVWLWNKFYYSLLSVSIGSGLLTLVGGFSAKSAANKKAEATKLEIGKIGQLLGKSLPLTAGIFTALLLAALSLATSALIKVAYNSARTEGSRLYRLGAGVTDIFKLNYAGQVAAWPDLSAFTVQNVWWHLEVLFQSPTSLVLFILLLLAAIGLLMGFFINVNKFSLHSAYRDRLVRAYLGASQATRRPNAFTGFDEQDNVQMHDLLTARFHPESFKDEKLSDLVDKLKPKSDTTAAPEPAAQNGLEAARKECAELISNRLSPATINLFDKAAAVLRNFDKTAAAPSDGDAQVLADLKQALADDFNLIIQDEPLVAYFDRIKDQPADQLDALKGFDRIYKEEYDQQQRRSSGLKPLSVAAVVARQPDVPFFPYRRLEWVNRLKGVKKTVLVEKLLINRLLIERAFPDEIKAAEDLAANDLAQQDGAMGAHPLHVINIALNLVAGKELAWQERKAQSFTVSPLHVGSHGLGYRPVHEYAVSRQQQGALTLGTALAISGAAVSPNMGYHSSPLVTFLLTLFNVRLGWWLGNPGAAGGRSYTKPSPFFAPNSLLAETFGMTDSDHGYVYLSDGAHFENLALYEMVRRRCHLIIVSDAGADPDFGFEDLGNAVRKIQIDLGVPIEFQDLRIRARAKPEALFAAQEPDQVEERKYCALATIHYPQVDGKYAEPGWLIYIKPTVYGAEPKDVLSYAKANPTFPHETTGDQMYSESQFESYRALGDFIISRIIGNDEVGNLAGLRSKVERHLKS